VEETGKRKIPLLVLVGPTAVGKSRLALEVAPRIGAEIISADSAQVYRYMDIGTAKPTAREQELVKHHLIDLVDPDQDFSVSDFQREADRVISQLYRGGKLPFMVGGTGLYVNAVIDRYVFQGRGKNIGLRRQLQQAAREQGLEVLYRRLAEVDPAAAAKIHPNDQKRIIRALEVYYQDGIPISRQVELTRRQESPYRLLMFGLNMEREELYRRIDRRVEEMMAAGFLEETRRLLEKGFKPDSPGLQVLGYRQLVRYLENGKGWKETVAEIKKETRQLAKRQLTWFRRDRRIIWLQAEDGLEALEELISRAVKEKLTSHAN
jgi:tRNA dimethylallyltransferase